MVKPNKGVMNQGKVLLFQIKDTIYQDNVVYMSSKEVKIRIKRLQNAIGDKLYIKTVDYAIKIETMLKISR